MEEIERIADRITVLRDGQWIGTAPAAELPAAEIDSMDGRARSGRTIPAPRARIRARNGCGWKISACFPAGFSARPAVDKVSLSVRAGEVRRAWRLARFRRERIVPRALRRLRRPHPREGRAGGRPARFASPAPGHCRRRGVADQRPQGHRPGPVAVRHRQRHAGRFARALARRLAASGPRTTPPPKT